MKSAIAKTRKCGIIRASAALCWTEAAAGGKTMNNETKRGTYSVHDMVRISVLVAIMLLLEVTGLGMIRMPGLELTLLMVPVIVGAIVMGPASGAILGGVFGCISFWECFGRSQFGAVLLGINPIYTFLVCVPTRILAGWLCGVAFKGLNKLDKTNLWSFLSLIHI